MRKYLRPFELFVRWQASSGVVLFASALMALIWRNSFLGDTYVSLAHEAQWMVNDMLMPFFFLMVGLEIKRELMGGELSGLQRAMLPVAAALGGMVVPALLYIGINWHHPNHWIGWGIPMATDIAFALGVLALLGSRIPRNLKIFLTAVAIVDDLGAVLVIAIFYTRTLNVAYLGIALVLIVCLMLLNRLRILSSWGYVLLGIALWWAVFRSGIHPTIAGVVVAFCVPRSELQRWERVLHFPVSYGVMPIFGLLNAGVALSGGVWTWDPVMLGVMGGLIVGKVIGISGMTWICVKSKMARLPDHLDFRWMMAASWVAGIGFTMAFFIADLALIGLPGEIEQAKLGILMASVLAGCVGAFFLLRRARQH